MATITNFNNKAPLEQDKSTANVVPGSEGSGTPTAPQPVRPASGQYSTLQKYLGANQNVGGRLGGMLQTNIQNEANKNQATTGRELGEANQANQDLTGLTGETNKYTTDLTGDNSVSSTGGGYDANAYSTNLSGQKAASDIAANADSLNKFRDTSTGKLGGAAIGKSQQETSQAQNAANLQDQLNKQRQQEINNESKRAQLLSQTLNTQNQRSGLRSLDNAFLSQDKTNKISDINNLLRQNMAGIQQNVGKAGEYAGAVGGLGTNQTNAETGLRNRVTTMNDLYNQELNKRVDPLNAAKQERYNGLVNQFNQLRGDNTATEDFANEMGLFDVQAANPNQYNPNPSTSMGMPQPGEGVRLFNVLKNAEQGSGGLDTFLNSEKLKQQALSGRDVANTQDVSNLNALRALAGQTNDITESQFTGRQTDPSKMTAALNQRGEQFRNQDLGQRYNSVSDLISRQSPASLFELPTTYYGRGAATGTLEDVLNRNQIGRNVAGGTQTGPFTSQDFLVPQVTSTPYDYQPANYTENRGDSLQNQAVSQAEQQAVGGVQNQANTALQNMGYNNLLKILRGGTQ